MLTEAQKSRLKQSVRETLQDFDQSGSAFTTSMLISSVRESSAAADERLLDDSDAEAFVTDVVARRRDELDVVHDKSCIGSRSGAEMGVKDAS